MDLPSSKVIEVLEGKGVSELYHANSVLTATQFLRKGALLARGTIQRRKLFQTAQSSDALDKAKSLWFDVFTDSVDIHHRAKRANEYGPVLFVLDIEKVKRMYKGRLWITKKNPTKWEKLDREDRWFQSIEELQQKFSVGTFDQMIVFRHSGGELPIKRCLKKIILDDPRAVLSIGSEEIDAFSMSYGAIQVSMTEGRINVPIERRACPTPCKCSTRYSQIDFTVTMFCPVTKIPNGAANARL